MYLIYRFLTLVSLIFLAPYYALRALRHGQRHAVRERFGILPREIVAQVAAQSAAGAIWIHAVSVGEVLAATPLVERLKRRMPARALYVSTTTETGQRLARERLKCANAVFYFPLDMVFAVRGALRALRPAAIVMMETEVWPNFLREAARLEIPVIVANARISERAFARYNRWKFLVLEFYAEALRYARWFLAQTPADAERLRAMGAPQEKIEVTGNMKFDGEPAQLSTFGAWLAEQAAGQERWPLVVAGSVLALEEDAVLAAYDIVQRRWRRALLVLAPRKPDRFGEAAELIEAAGWRLIRRSRVDLAARLDEDVDVVLLDSIGELAGLYSIADAVFVGGSLVPAGGHNILEPAWFGRPPVFGDSMENFREMAEQFLSAHAAVQVGSGPELGKVWAQLIENPALRERMGKAAREVCERNRGATARCVERIRGLLEAAGRAG